MRLTECRSCGASIFWAETAKGKRIPMDAEPDPAGKFVIAEEALDPNGRRVEVFAEYFPDAKGEDRYVCHFATCPDGKEWRRA